MSNNEQPITTAQAAQVLRVDVRTVHRLAESGQLPSVLKLPGRTGAWLFDPQVVERVAAGRAADGVPA